MYWKRVIALPFVLAASFASAQGAFTQEELEKMVKELEAHAPKNSAYLYPIKVTLESNPKVNAYATVEDTPDKKLQTVMVVFTGLVDHVKGDRNQIRAVVAHEISHLGHGHCTGPLWKARDLGQFWTRQQEAEADASGAALLVRAGYKRDHMVEMLKSLDKLGTNWTYKIWSDHASPLQRAAKVADDPSIFESLLQFDIARAFWQSRNFKRSSELFDSVFALEPRLFSAAINAAGTSLMHYYDRLPGAIHEQWYRPDFGPLLAPNPIDPSRDPAIREEDRVRFKEAMAKIDRAMGVAGDQPKIQEYKALAQILNPDGTKSEIEEGITWHEERLKAIAADDLTRNMRFHNNIAVGLKRLGRESEAVDTLTKVVSETGKVNYVLGENLSRGARVEKEGGLGANVMAYWLKLASQQSPHFNRIKTRYTDFCKQLNVKAEEIGPSPETYLPVLTMNIEGKDVNLYDRYSDLAMIGGKPDKAVFFDERFKNLLDVQWKGGDLQAFVEDDLLLRITSRLVGSFVEMRSSDPAVTDAKRITVGMSEDEFKKILDPEEAETELLSNLGKAEEWLYFAPYYLAVKIEAGKVAAISFTPVEKLQ